MIGKAVQSCGMMHAFLVILFMQQVELCTVVHQVGSGLMVYLGFCVTQHWYSILWEYIAKNRMIVTIDGSGRDCNTPCCCCYLL